VEKKSYLIRKKGEPSRNPVNRTLFDAFWTVLSPPKKINDARRCVWEEERVGQSEGGRKERRNLEKGTIRGGAKVIRNA